MLAPMRHVRGVLFVDYVRMLRRMKHIEWARTLPADDITYLSTQIDPTAWYPMETFERFGNEILHNVAQGQLSVVQLWGKYSAGQLRTAHPLLLAPADPVETMNRFHVMRQTFFDFEALHIPQLHDGEAQIAIHYYMGMPAEEAASYQTVGFFEGLLELAGAKQITSQFLERSWFGGPYTLVELHWDTPPAMTN